jgi:SAM-dependent methyltransferase
MTIKTLIRKTLEAQVVKYGYELRRTRGAYQSETSKCRKRLAPYCIGQGVDLGPGGDPITETAIRVDLPQPYSQAGLLPPQLRGDARKLIWFRDACLDYVYSSHLLEDFEDTKPILIEWLRVLKPGGHLVLFCPDERVFREHCRATGQRYNEMHKQPDFSLAKVEVILTDIGQTTTFHTTPLIDIYSWELVARKSR